MPSQQQTAFLEDMQVEVPAAKQPKPAIIGPSEKEMQKQVEKARNKAAREERERKEKEFAEKSKQLAAMRKKEDALEEYAWQYSAESKALKKDLKEMGVPASVTLKKELAAAKKLRDEVLKDIKKDTLSKDDRTYENDLTNSQYYTKIAKAYDKYATAVSDDKHELRSARTAQETAQLKADSLDRKINISQMQEGPEKKKMEATYDRHKWFDRFKTIFRKENAVSHQDASFSHGDKEFTNTGRAFYGGTKPMYKFKDEAGNTHLFKEAVNCLGMAKPEGALVTEAASKVQALVCGDAHVPAFTVTSKEGRVLGSMQQMLVKDDKGLDLFALQDDVKKMGETFKEKPQLVNELIREHALDWMLCNYDTKGENFIPLKTPNADGSTLTSIDKEASFSFLKDEGSQNMSYTYKPHSNNTFYNVMFKAYAENKIDFKMDAMDEMVSKIEKIPNDEYMDCFKGMLDNKYGEGTKERQQAHDSILARKEGIGGQYKTFRKEMELERTKNKNLGDKNKTQDKTKDQKENDKKQAAPSKGGKGH